MLVDHQTAHICAVPRRVIHSRAIDPSVAQASLLANRQEPPTSQANDSKHKWHKLARWLYNPHSRCIQGEVREVARQRRLQHRLREQTAFNTMALLKMSRPELTSPTEISTQMMAHMAVGDSSGEIIMFMFGVEPTIAHPNGFSG